MIWIKRLLSMWKWLPQRVGCSVVLLAGDEVNV